MRAFQSLETATSRKKGAYFLLLDGERRRRRKEGGRVCGDRSLSKHHIYIHVLGGQRREGEGRQGGREGGREECRKL